jgi:uncharacterized protein YcfJ
MKLKMMILPLALTLASSPLFAGHGHGHHHMNKHLPQNVTVKARVSHVEPLYKVVRVPQQHRQCHNEVVHGTRTRHSNGGMLVGAVIGGVIGHNLGDERHRKATTAMGTVIGAAIGHDSDRSYQSPYRYTEQRCKVTTNYVNQKRNKGYRVSYRYQGKGYVTHMDRRPGKFVHVKVSHRLLD